MPVGPARPDRKGSLNERLTWAVLEFEGPPRHRGGPVSEKPKPPRGVRSTCRRHRAGGDCAAVVRTGRPGGQSMSIGAAGPCCYGRRLQG